MDGHRLFRKDREGNWGGGAALYISDQLECMELQLGMGEEPSQSLWVRITGRAGRGDIIVGGLLQTTWPGSVREALYRQMGITLWSQSLVLMGDFNHPGICWMDNTAGLKQSWRLLECINVNFLLQVTEEPVRWHAMLDFVLTDKMRLVGTGQLKGSLGYSDH